MKKLRLAAALMLLFAAVISAGCGLRKIDGYASATDATNDNTTAPATAATSAVTADAEDYFTEHGEGVTPEPEKIPDFMTPTQTEHLYSCNFGEIGAGASVGYGLTVGCAGDYFCVSYMKGTLTCDVFSLSSGEQVTHLELSDRTGECSVYPDGSLIASHYSDESGVRLDRYSISGELTHTYLLPEETVIHVISNDGRYVAVLDTDGVIRIYELGSEMTFVAETDAGHTGLFSGAGDNSFLCDISGSGATRIDITGKTTRLSLPSMPVDSLEELYRCETTSGLLLSDGTAEGRNFIMNYFVAGEWFAAAENGVVLTMSFSDASECYTVRAYDLRRGTLDAAFDVPDSVMGMYAMFTPNGRVVLVAGDISGVAQYTVYVYDLPAALAEEHESTRVEALVCTEDELWDTIDSIAREIERDTGITVKYGSEGNDYVVYGYASAAEKNPYTVFVYLCGMKSILSLYPEGMMREVYSETNKGFIIYLSGTICSSGGVSFPSGVTSEHDGYIVIVVDASAGIGNTLVHELSHAFDRRIEYVGANNGVDYMEMWLAATEVPNAYTETYDDYYYNDAYTYQGETDLSRVWFVDNYSRTFPTEDRARIMERLYDSRFGALSPCFGSEHLSAKARLYCRILEECFPSVASAEKPPFWEMILADANR